MPTQRTLRRCFSSTFSPQTSGSFPSFIACSCTGLNLRFDKTVDLSAIVNVTRLKDGRLQFTAVPLLYGSYTTSSGAGTFSLEPPARLNVAARLPVVGQPSIEEATEKLAGDRNRAGLSTTESTSATPRSPMQLVRSSVPSLRAETADRPPPSRTPLPEEPVLPAAPWRSNPMTPAVAATPCPRHKGGDSPPPSSSPTPASIATTAGGRWPTCAARADASRAPRKRA